MSPAHGAHLSCAPRAREALSRSFETVGHVAQRRHLCRSQTMCLRASPLHVVRPMAIDLLALLRRDHEDLERGLTALLDPNLPIPHLRTVLDGVRLGLAAHAEAEDIVFH